MILKRIFFVLFCPFIDSLCSAAVSESANVSGAQGRRLEESSAAGGSLPGLRLNQNSNQAVLSHLMANADNAEPDDDFFDMLVKCQVGHTCVFIQIS